MYQSTQKEASFPDQHACPTLFPLARMPVPGRRLLHARVLDRKLGVGVATQVRPVNVLEHTKVPVDIELDPQLKACLTFSRVLPERCFLSADSSSLQLLIMLSQTHSGQCASNYNPSMHQQLEC